MLVSVYNVQGTCDRLEAGVEIGAAKYMYVHWESGAGLGEESYGLKHPKQDVQCFYVATVVSCPDRLERLLADMELPRVRLTTAQHQQLTQLLEEYSDVFALSDSELG